MKKKQFILIECLLFTVLIFSGCNSQIISYNEKKPNIYFYTQKLCSLIDATDDFSVILFQSDLHKKVDITKEAIPVLKNFINDIKLDDFIEKPDNIPEIPPYKLFITIDDTKYVVNIYDKSTLSIHTWDGVFKEDFLTMDNVHSAYNLYGLCKYVFTFK